MVLFLSFNRHQKVSFGPSLSGPQLTHVRVSQGTILGPLLFSIFINDLFSCYKKMILADDSTILFVGHKLSTIESSIQSDLNNIEKWCQNDFKCGENKSYGDIHQT